LKEKNSEKYMGHTLTLTQVNEEIYITTNFKTFFNGQVWRSIFKIKDWWTTFSLKRDIKLVKPNSQWMTIVEDKDR